MATNLALDDELILEAQRLGGHKTKKEAVTVALEDYVRKQLRKEVVASFGTVEFDPDWDYKELRRRDLRRIPHWDE